MKDYITYWIHFYSFKNNLVIDHKSSNVLIVKKNIYDREKIKVLIIPLPTGNHY